MNLDNLGFAATVWGMVFSTQRLSRHLPRSAVVSAAGAVAALSVAALNHWVRHPVSLVTPHAPVLLGERRIFNTALGPVPARVLVGDLSAGQVVVLLHGWGGSADGAWWRLLPELRPSPAAMSEPHLGTSLEPLEPQPASNSTPLVSFVALDLPGHGNFALPEGVEFSLDLAASYVVAALEAIVSEFGVDSVRLVAVSMGGPIALLAARQAPQLCAEMVLVATSAYWSNPRPRLLTTLGPVLLAESSPVALLRRRHQVTSAPDLASFYLWGASLRPPRKVLTEAARSLRHFDARDWVGVALPPITWVVTVRDGIIDPADQRASAEQFGAKVVELDSSHSASFTAPDTLASVVLASLGAAGLS